MRRPPVVPSVVTLLAALAVLGAAACEDGADGPTGPALICPGSTAQAATVGGDWRGEGERPTTLTLVQEGAGVRATLALAGGQRTGGTGTVRGGCVAVVFPPRAGSDEAVLQLRGELLPQARMRVLLQEGRGAASQQVLVRQ